MKSKSTAWTIVTLICLTLILLSCTESSHEPAFISTTSGIGIPEVSTTDFIAARSGFTLCWSEEDRLPRWVAWTVTKDQLLNDSLGRESSFHTDTYVPGTSASPSDYTGTGFDRGHMAPAGDMGYSPDAMHDCFAMSNICPQNPGLNRGEWEKLEAQTRTWAMLYDSIFVTAGPILKAPLPKIDTTGISIPDYYYKALLVYTGSHQAAIGFIMRNENTDLPFSHFSVTVDSVEAFAGIDLFAGLENETEAAIESRIDQTVWAVRERSPARASAKTQRKQARLAVPAIDRSESNVQIIIKNK